MFGMLSKIVQKHPWWVLIFFLLFSVYFALGINPEKRPVLENSLPPDNPRVQEDEQLKLAFENHDYAAIALTCSGESGCITTRAYLLRVHALSQAAENSSIIADDAVVHSLTDLDYIDADSAGEIRVGDFVRQMPESAKEEQALYARAAADYLLWGRIVSEDGQSSLLVFRLSEDATQNEVHDELERLVALFKDPEEGFDAGVYANHYQNREFEIEADREFARFGIVSFVLIFVIMSNVLGWQAALCILSAISVSIVWSLGILGRLGYLQNVLTTSLPVVLTAVVSSHGYHMMEAMIRARRDGNKTRDSVSIAMRNIASSVFAGGATSALGFLSLVAIPVYSLSEYGLFAAAGVLAGVVVSILMLPALVLTIAPGAIRAKESRRSIWIRARVKKFLELCMWIGIHPKRARIAVWVSVFLVILSGFGVKELQVQSEPAHFIPEDRPARAGFDLLEEHHHGTAFVRVMLDCGEGRALEPKCLRAAEELADYAEGLPDVVFVTSLADRVARLNGVMLHGDTMHDALPRSKEAVSQLLVFDSEDVLGELRDSTDRYLMMNLFIYAFDSKRIEAVYRAVSAKVREMELFYQGEEEFKFLAYLGGEFFVWAEMIATIGRTGLRSVNAVALFIVGFCVIFFRSLKLGSFALLPVGIAGWLVFGLMGAMGIHIDIANVTLAVITGAMTVDFYVHLVNRARVIILGSNRELGVREAMVGAVREAGVPIVFDCISNLSFVTLMISNFVPIRNLGWLLCAAMVAALVTTMIIVPSVTTILPNFFFKRERKRLEVRLARGSKLTPEPAAL